MRYESRGMPFIRVLTVLICTATGFAQPTRISDNSFLIEEAYNQERGVVQHIVLLENIFAYRDKFSNDDMGMTFAQEWPLGTQTFQGAYAVSSDREFDDVWLDLQLRYQMPMQDNPLAMAPYVKVAIPIGESVGNDIDGVPIGIGLPISAMLSNYWTMHVNLAAEYFRWKEIRVPVRGANLLIENESAAVSGTIGASLIHSISPTFDVMLESLLTKGLRDESRNREVEEEAFISPGFRQAWNFTSGAQMVGGLGFPIGLKGDVPDIAGLLYLSFEHSFSGN